MTHGRVKPAPPEDSGDPKIDVEVIVNGEKVVRRVSVRMLLSDFLRHELGLTGTHVGCEHGVCGCCTVHIDGRLRSFLPDLGCAGNGGSVRTIEFVAAEDGTLHPIQQAFKECHALQCGYCTPGMMMNILGAIRGAEPLDLSDDGNSLHPVRQSVSLHRLLEHRRLRFAGRPSSSAGPDWRQETCRPVCSAPGSNATSIRSCCAARAPLSTIFR